MFKQRLLTTITLIPLALLAIYFVPAWILGLVVLALLAVGGWEWARLMPIQSKPLKLTFVAVLLVLSGLCFYWLEGWIFITIAAWVLILFAVLTFPATQPSWGYPGIVGLFCYIVFPTFGACLAAVYLLPQGKDLIVYLLCLVWAADVGAYVTGKICGHTKLIPKVSPGKTIEGVLGGFLLSILVSVAAYFYFAPGYQVFWFLLAGIVAVVSVLGDLFISILKRRCQVKDSGHVFPGHGGVLDRFDSLIAALPVFYLGMNCIFN